MNKKIIIFVVIGLFIGAGVLPSISGYDMEYSQNNNDLLMKGWAYKTNINLDSPTTVDEYQVKIILNTEIFDYSKANRDGSDIRFYDEAGNKLSYWIEEWNPSGNSVLWINVLEAGTTIIYLYSGNTEAKSESNGDATFIFFDDFNDLNYSKWFKYPKPKDAEATISDGVLRFQDLSGYSSHLFSNATIPIGTRMIFRFKEEYTNEAKKLGWRPNAQRIGLYEGVSNENNSIYCYDSDKFTDLWRFQTQCNKVSTTTTIDSGYRGQQDIYSYNVFEYLWSYDLASYFYNNKLKATHTENVPAVNLRIAICAQELNAIICDWILVTKIPEGPYINGTLFEDNFNKSHLDLTKWNETYSDGKYKLINDRIEFELSEKNNIDDPNKYEGLESSIFNVTLTQKEAVSIKWQIDTNINSTSTVGSVRLRVLDEKNTRWLQIYYGISDNRLYFTDSNDVQPTDLMREAPDGKYQFEILIYSDRYIVWTDETNSEWVMENLFESNTKLKIMIYITNGGTQPGLIQRSAFDNISITLPNYGKIAPYAPLIVLDEDDNWGIRSSLKSKIEIIATDPDYDPMYLYVDWGDNTTSKWIYPVASDETITLEHTWKKMGDYILQAKVIDINGFISPLRKIDIKMRWVHSKTLISNLFEKFVEYYLAMFYIIN